jgi:hypothetical protein
VLGVVSFVSYGPSITIMLIITTLYQHRLSTLQTVRF